MEREIEVFRSGRSSRGITPENLAEVAEFDCSASPVAICFGHPKNDTPAAGTISKLRAAGNSLFATVSDLSKKAVDGIKDGSWLTPSFAFFDPTHEANPTPGKWAPRHLGLLGAAAPGIPGLGTLKQTLAFDADGGLINEGDPADAIVFSGAPTEVHFVFDSKEKLIMADEKTPEQLAEAQRLKDEATAFEARKSEFDKRVRTAFEAGNSSIVDAAVTAGKVLPAEAADLKLVFNAFDPEGEELTFGAGDKTTKASAVTGLANFINGLPKRVPLGERQSPDKEFSAGEKLTSKQIEAKANELIAADKSLTFEAAVAQVQEAIDAA